MKNHKLMFIQLNRQLEEWQILKQKYGRPRIGWVKLIRNTLGMTAQQLAERLGLARSRIIQLENAEINDGVTLRTLKKAAEAMDCELIYAIVPKNSLEEIIKTRAMDLAEKAITHVAHSMSLEAQSVEKDRQKKQKERLVKKLLTGSLKKIWKNKL